MAVPTIPRERLVPILERAAADFGDEQHASWESLAHHLAAGTGKTVGAWQRTLYRIRTGNSDTTRNGERVHAVQATVTVRTVDEILTALDRADVWHVELADVAA